MGGPASPADLATWARQYRVDFPFGLDTALHGAFVSAAVAPFNVLIDARTMRIVLTATGDASAVIDRKVQELVGPGTP